MDTREIARIVATNTARIDLPIWHLVTIGALLECSCILLQYQVMSSIRKSEFKFEGLKPDPSRSTCWYCQKVRKWQMCK